MQRRRVAAGLCVTAATQVWHRSIGPRREAPLRRRRGPGGVGRRGAVVCASHCWGTTCPSGPTASRATRTHARSTIFALRAIRPVRVHASAWSPKASTSPPHLGGPQRLAHKGSGRRKLRRRAKSIAWGGSTQAGSQGIAVNQAPACGPACDRRRGQGRQQRAFAKVMIAIHVATHPGLGRSSAVDGLPLRLLPKKDTLANPPPEGARVPQLRS